MKIAFLTEHMLFWNGGVRYLYEVTRRLAKDNEVTVFCGATSLANKERFYNAGVKVDVTVLKFENSIKYWLLYPFCAFTNALHAYRMAQNGSYDIFFSNNPSTHLITLLARIKPILIVMELNPWVYSKSFQGGLTPLQRFIVKFWSPVAKYLEKKAYQNAVKIIVWSKFVQSEVKRVYGVDSEVVYTGIDTEFFKKTENTELNEKYKGKRIILHVASYLSPMKGTDYAIEAMEYINKEFANAVLLIIYSHKDKYRFGELMVKALKNKATVVFINGVQDEDIPAYYSLAEVLLAPSLDENVHLPQLEAQSCGCPVVTLRGKQISEETTHGIGYVVDKKDLHSAVIDCLKYKRDHHCRKFILDNFTWDKCIESYKRIINEVVS